IQIEDTPIANDENDDAGSKVNNGSGKTDLENPGRNRRCLHWMNDAVEGNNPPRQSRKYGQPQRRPKPSSRNQQSRENKKECEKNSFEHKPADLRYPEEDLQKRRKGSPVHSPSGRKTEGDRGRHHEPRADSGYRIVGTSPGNQQTKRECAKGENQDLHVTIN